MYPPTTPEYCITEALREVDTNAFPTLSSMFDDSRSNNPFTDSVREDFCFACCLHGLVKESSIETLLGENTYQTLPAGGRYIKDNLVTQCLAVPEKMQSLINELDNMDGNVGAVCQALTEVC
jgi:mediator of RNA polymerase II transcription subunit 5